MSKKIDSTLKELIKALKKHAEVTGAPRVPIKRAQKAAARVQAAVNAYTEAVHTKTGLPSPFTDLIEPGLDEDTLRSLKSERDAVLRRHNVFVA
ncbi:hypothetical protein G3T36_08810 [Diaminobutyricibacter tongyongensis]|uniref:Uncharacterized protein n=1 Tax=Leifsonia tongyongensis TaxID=1268043 RepID=A0A6L9XY72_9MICO|nr:hypothetical protein [Diaminobutyricibacter tongyongensis]